MHKFNDPDLILFRRTGGLRKGPFEISKRSAMEQALLFPEFYKACQDNGPVFDSG
jgi:hypothetical protein